MDDKYNGSEYIKWKKSYLGRLNKGLTVPIIVEILQCKEYTQYDDLTEDINKKYNLQLTKSNIDSICSKTKSKLYEYDFDPIIFPEQTITYNNAIELKELIKQPIGRQKKYTDKQEDEIIEIFKNDIHTPIRSVVNQYKIDRNAITNMRHRARKQLREE